MKTQELTIRRTSTRPAKVFDVVPVGQQTGVGSKVTMVYIAPTRENAQMLANSPKLRDELRNLIDAARLVIERWSEGDLADAVNGLRVDAKNAEALLGEEKEWPGD